MRLAYRNQHLCAVLFFTIAAIWLRFKGLTFESYWHDELATLWLTDPDNNFHFVFYETLNDKTTPLYQILQWIWFQIFGFTEFAGRSLPALAGSGSVIVIYLLAKELYNKDVGLYALIISTFNHYLINYSQEARSYSLLFFLSALSCYFLVKAVRKNNNLFLSLYTLSGVLLVQTHYYGILLYTSQICFLLICIFYLNILDRKRIKFLFINVLVTLVSLLPAIPYILHNASIKPPGMTGIKVWFFIEYLMVYSGGVFALFLPLLIYSIWFHLKKTCKYDRLNFYLFLTVIIFIFLIPYLRSVISVPMLHHRYTIVALPIIIILVAHAIDLFNSEKTKFFLLSMVIVLSVTTLWINKEYYPNQSFREVLTAVNMENDSHPVIACMSHRVNKYLKMLHINMKTISFKEFSNLIDDHNINRFWLIYHSNSPCNKIKDSREKLVEEYKLNQIIFHEGKKVYAYLYEKDR